MNDNKENIEQILEHVTFDDEPDPRHQDLLEQKLLLNFDGTRSRHNFKWRIIMNNRIAKLAAAAVIVIGVFVGFAIITETGSVSWAQVREQVAAVRAVTYKAAVIGSERGQAFESRIEGVFAEGLGSLLDIYMDNQLVSQTFALDEDISHITLLNAQKKYIEVELTEKNRLDNGDPKAMVEAFLQGDYKELGRREMNGVTVMDVFDAGEFINVIRRAVGSGDCCRIEQTAQQ